jgi:DNA-binding NarL/FixJ family response regulator
MTIADTPPVIPDGAIRPLVIDAHAGSRLGLALLLQREPWVERCLIARDGSHGAELARRHRPEVALLDISNAGPFVASSTALLHDAHPGLRIVLTSRCASELNAPPQSFGAAGFLRPEATADEIVHAVRDAVVAVEIPPPAPAASGTETLTERERQLLSLICTGATNKEIARRLHLGPDSVKKSASSLYRKLGVRNRTEAAQRAAGLIAPLRSPT